MTEDTTLTPAIFIEIVWTMWNMSDQKATGCGVLSAQANTGFGINPDYIMTDKLLTINEFKLLHLINIKLPEEYRLILKYLA